MSYTVSDLDDFLENYEEEDYGDVWSRIAYGEKFEVDAPNIGKITDEDRGGVHHDGADIFAVIAVEDANHTVRMFRKEGRYSSWDGDFWDGRIHEVEAYTEPKTLYRAI